MKNLTSLTLSFTPRVTDESLKRLARLKRLNHLVLSLPSDRTLKALREANLLHALAQASGADGRRPNAPEEVVSLDLWGCHVTSEGLKEIAVFTNLTSLNLFECPVTDAGLKEVARLKKLTRLHLTQTGVNGRGPEGAGRADGLTELSLSGTRVTDEGLVWLRDRVYVQTRVGHRELVREPGARKHDHHRAQCVDQVEEEAVAGGAGEAW